MLKVNLLHNKKYTARVAPRQKILYLGLLTLLLLLFFMTFRLSGNITYILQLRGQVAATLLLVAFATSLSTLLFQTITHNRILSPAIMGVEALFVLIQTLLTFMAHDHLQTHWLANIGYFIGETVLLVLFSLLLYRWLFTSLHGNIHLVLMIGIILGTLFHGSATLLQRLMDPSEFAILQSRLFATFTRTTPDLILFSLLIVMITGTLLWRMRYRFDVLALGREHAINLGIDYHQQVTTILLLISILVAVSTALVGPLTFLGLMIANLAYLVTGSQQHRYLLPVAFLLGAIALIGGQLILQYALNMSGTLSVVIEFIGGLFFIFLLLKRR